MSNFRNAIEVRHLGREGEPVVIVDDFSGEAFRLLATGREAEFEDAGAGFPGLRAPARSDYLFSRQELIGTVMQRVFGFRQGIECNVATFSLVTHAESDLQPAQRIPHYDHCNPGRIAIMHYLLGPETGGTAFYRHRKTGFETIGVKREEEYNEALWEEERELGPPPARYLYGDDDRFEMIGEVEARPDRLIFYRSWLLHAPVIPDVSMLTDDPKMGRLTINMFLTAA